MRYLLSALAVLVALYLIFLNVPLHSPKAKPTEGSLVINQRVYLPQELKERMGTASYHFDSDGEQLTNLIYRELLLQEAKKQKIDFNPNFLHSMQDFYEQSMIKTLLDLEYNQDSHQPNASQVASCLPLLTRKFEIKEIEYPDYETALNQTSGLTENYNLSFLQLPEDVRTPLMDLKGTDLSPPIQSGTIWIRLQILNITQIPAPDIPPPIEQEEHCRQELKRQSVQNWLDGLYRKAKILKPEGLGGGTHG